MPQGTQASVMGAYPHAPRMRKPSLHMLGIAALALIGLVGAATASADSLALRSGGGQSGLIGQPGAQSLVVEVRDVDGAPIAGRSISWSTGDGFQVGAAATLTDANGRASVGFTYGNYGTTDIVATDTATDAQVQAPETSVGADSITLVSGGGQTGQAGAPAAQPIVVQVLDAAGSPVAGRAVNWSDTTAYTHVDAPSSTTNASGQASMGFSFLTGPLAIGGTPAGIMATNSTGAQSVTANVVEIGIDFMTITSARQVTGLLGQTSAPIVAHVTDWQGNPIAGATVNWSTPQPGIFNLSSTSTLTDASGNASITAQYVATHGEDIITAEYNGIEQDVHFFIQSATHMEGLSPNPIIGSPNTASTTPMMIQDFNNDGTPRVGDTITWTLQSGDAVPNSPTSVTDANGKATVGFTFGTQFSQFDAADTRGVHRSLTVSPFGSGQAVQLVSGAGQIGLSLTAATNPVVMRVVDQSGNPVAGATVNWTQYANGTFGFNGNVNFTSSTTSISDANGLVQVSFSYGAIGKIAIRGELLSGNGLAATVTSYGTGTLVVLTGSGQSGLVGTHGAQPVVVEYRDAVGNPVAGQTINWSLNLGNAVLDAATSVTNASGQASMGFAYGATVSINAIKAENTATSGIDAVAIVTGVGADALNVISGNGQNGIADAHGAQPLVVEVRDAAGQVVSGRSIQWTSSTGAATPDAASSVTDASGRASIGFTFGSLPSSTITATDATSGHQAIFTLSTSKPQGHAAIVSGNGQAGLPGATGQPIVIELFDESGAVEGVGQGSGVWSVVSGPATLTGSTTSTDANGHVTASFNFGPTPGTSIIQFSDNHPNPQFVQVAIITLANNQGLSIVSGDGQQLIGATPSQPLIVQLKDFNNAPVAGATIGWTATNGTLQSASSVTDANGKASNIVTPNGSGNAVSVQASSTRAAAPVTFDFTIGIAHLPGLTPAQAATAAAIDNACPALASISNPTPQQADLLAQCRALEAASVQDSGATVHALNQLITKTAEVQSSAASVAAVTQFQNINARLTALRSGSPNASQGLSLAGLAFNNGSNMVPFGAMFDAFLAANAASAQGKDSASAAGFARWGLFVTGQLGHGAASPGSLTPGYAFDTNGLTFGIDYRKQDNWIFGAALGYSRQDTALAQAAGSVGMTGYSLSLYNTYSFKKTWYLDSVVTLGHNSFDQTRRIVYSLPLPGGSSINVDQTASSHPGGSFREAALTFGGDFHQAAWNFSPYGQLIWNRLGFDAYQETLQAGPGSGLGLAVAARSVTGLSSILGGRVSYSHSANFGVLTPTASLEWTHEFRSDPKAIAAQFINDPTHTPIAIFGDKLDSDYLRMGLGLSALFPQGRSAFVLYERTLQRSGLSQYNVSLGLRLEF